MCPLLGGPQQLLINNEFVDSVTGKKFSSYDPRTGDKLVDVAEAQVEDVDRAVKAAKKVGQGTATGAAPRAVRLCWQGTSASTQCCSVACGNHCKLVSEGGPSSL